MIIHLSTSLKYYKRPQIQEALVRHAFQKEVAMRFNDSFGKRPDVLQYPGDVLEMAKRGATSFHSSEELWSNPLHLQPSMERKQLDELRTGWDLVLDVDCKFLEYSKLAADLIVRAILHKNVSSLSVKFSGNHGFHIGIPFHAFPQEINGVEMRLLFPEAAKRVALYIKEKITVPLAKKVLEMEGGQFNAIAQKTGIPVEKIAKAADGSIIMDEQGKAVPNVDPFLVIDTVLISSRHLYRMPYSLNEKSGLVSIPISPSNILDFDKEEAAPDKVVVSSYSFLDRSSVRPNDARQLFIEAFDATAKEQSYGLESQEKTYEMPAEAIPEAFFPPCIQKLLQGVEDGRKRALFILINFLSSCGWSYEAMEARLIAWNKSNKSPIPQTYLVGQLRYHRQHKKRVLPPNCHNPAYYQDLRVKCSEDICSRFKNPVGYARRKSSK